MRGKILLVVGLATGYVLGAKAGRGRYEDIKRATDKFWGDPRVQRNSSTGGSSSGKKRAGTSSSARSVAAKPASASGK